MSEIEQLNARLIDCRLCPRLVDWREQVAREKRKSYAGDTYWGRPVPYFGDPEARHLIVGLAPAAHGANRTGRMFTGDRSGDWLFRALHKAGIANQPTSERIDDGLTLTGALIAATAHCAPPANKPTPEEVSNCSSYLKELLALDQFEAILCLGSIAWNHVHKLLDVKALPFGHAVTHILSGGRRIVASYHPSQQNTFTGKLTEPMLDRALQLWLYGADQSL
jgi:uracil-DNA glycosylase family 4